MNAPKTLLLILVAALGVTSCSTLGKLKKDRSGMYSIVEKGKYGYMNKSGTVVINPQFESASEFSEGMAIVYISQKCGYIDTSGKVIVNPQFDLALPFYGGIALVISEDSSGREMGYVDKEGKLVWRETKESAKGSPNMDNMNTTTNMTTNTSTTTTTNTSNSSNMNSSSSNTAASNSSSRQRTGHLTTDANLRTDPNKDAASVGIHFRSAKVRILDETSYEINGAVSSWYKIKVYEYGCSANANLGCGKNSSSDADEGWVNARLVLLD